MNMTKKRGCGCLLVVIAAVMVAVAAFFLVTSYVADEDAGMKNKQACEKYNANIPTIDSLEKAGVPDSIIAKKHPRPYIRQGGYRLRHHACSPYSTHYRPDFDAKKPKKALRNRPNRLVSLHFRLSSFGLAA